ncbi:MAG: hypothetical protein ACLQVA_19480, partial [Candidatus Brocadiia bacterium]
ARLAFGRRLLVGGDLGQMCIEPRWAAEEEARRNARLLAVREPGPPDDDPEEYEETRAIPDPLEVPHPLVPERQEPAPDREIPF